MNVYVKSVSLTLVLLFLAGITFGCGMQAKTTVVPNTVSEQSAGQPSTGFTKVDSFERGKARLALGQIKAEAWKQFSRGETESHRKTYVFSPPGQDVYERDVWIAGYGPQVPGMGTVRTIRITFSDGKISKLEVKGTSCP